MLALLHDSSEIEVTECFIAMEDCSRAEACVAVHSAVAVGVTAADSACFADTPVLALLDDSFSRTEVADFSTLIESRLVVEGYVAVCSTIAVGVTAVNLDWSAVTSALARNT